MEASTKDAADKTLLEGVARGDQMALQRLFTRHNVRIFRFLMRITQNRATAEELLNEVFLEVWQHAGRYEGRSAPMTWVLSIAHNKAISRLRKKSEVTGLEDDEMPEQAALDDTPEEALQKDDKARAMRECIAELTPDHREILDLVYYQERSVAEAAEILAIPENTVKTRMFYARKKLSELLKARGIDRGWP